jgi:hypothetical protein
MKIETLKTNNMNWFSKLFNKKMNETSEANSELDKNWLIGFRTFNTGKELYFDNKPIEALLFFDKAIQNSFDTAEAFEYRANCLYKLEYFFDAIDDYNISIQKDSEKQIVFYMRSLAKASIEDFIGQLDDINEAIRLSKLDNEDSRYWDKFAKETGFESAASKYKYDLLSVGISLSEEKYYKEECENANTPKEKEYSQQEIDKKRKERETRLNQIKRR